MALLFSHISRAWNDLLVRGEKTSLRWVSELDRKAIPLCLATIFLGVGLYGASIGIWQGPKLATYTAIKLPLIILITLTVNGMINGMLAVLLGSRLSFTQTAFAILTAFTVFALIVGSLSPVTMAMALDLPSPESLNAEVIHRRLLLTHTSIIALAGLVSTGRLFQLLTRFAETVAAARCCFAALIFGNLFVGAQISYLLRPIFGQPGLKIEFLRPDPFRGNFYESVWWALTHSF